MNKKTFYISDETVRVIKSKSSFFGNDSKAVDWMICDFSDSTPQEKIFQSFMRKKNLDKFLIENKKATKEEIWKAGFSTGWEQFQTRKLKKPLRRKLVK